MRSIKESAPYQRCVEALGGARVIDEALEPVVEALISNPYGFHAIQSDFSTLVRYAVVNAIADRTPALIFAFTVDDAGDVILEWVDEVME